jgi:glycosyltransferase involved in cell wall biosynthesis
MQKFRVVGDLKSNPFHSSRIIIDSANRAARELGYYDEQGTTVVYDCLCNSHGYQPDAFWCAYELPIPKIVAHNAQNKPLIGLSKENAWMFVEGGYSPKLTNYVTLGCDTSVWRPSDRKSKTKFIIGCSIESTVRSDIPIIIKAFGELFKGSRDVVLYIKDRNASSIFETYVKEKAIEYDITIVHDNRHIENFEEEKQLFYSWDVHCYLNRAGTFCMTVLQGMACGIATVSMRYSGPSDYLSHRINGMAVEYDLSYVTPAKLWELEQIGMRNFLFPPDFRYYNNQPYWAEFRLESVKNAFQELKDDTELREKLARNAVTTSKWFSWQRTALNMSFVLSELCPKE